MKKRTGKLNTGNKNIQSEYNDKIGVENCTKQIMWSEKKAHKEWNYPV